MAVRDDPWARGGRGQMRLGCSSVATIRVDPDKLRAAANLMAQMREMAEAMRGDALRLTSGAPSYDGQFGPQVQAIGDEAAARLKAVAAVLEGRMIS